MCARYSLKTSADVVQALFDLDETPEIGPRYNIAPTQPVVGVVAENGNRRLKWLQWGLVPSWAKDPSIGQKLINARAETLAEKPSFRAAFKRRRCLIAADGFYEWTEVAPKAAGGLFGDSEQAGKPYTQPFHIRMKDGGPFAFAGLWEYWEIADGGPIESCAIVTTEPNELLAKVHNRMPVILSEDEWEPWLDTSIPNPGPLVALLDPYPAEGMEMVPVTRRMGNPRYDAPDCIEAIPA